MAEYFEVMKVAGAGEPEEVASAWMENLHALEKEHPRVFKKIVREVLEYTEEKDLPNGLLALARELRERRKKSKNLQSVKIAMTCNKYLSYHYGSLVKLYHCGTIVYTSRATIDGCGFVIHGGRQVA